MPAVDRHIHLEGALDPGWARRRARELGQALPPALEALWAGRMQPFDDFIQAFLFGLRLLDSAGALEEAVLSAARRTRAAGGLGMDLWASPHLLTHRLGVLDAEAWLLGVDRGLERARKELGVAGAVVLDAVNHLGPGDGELLLDRFLPRRPDWIVGFSTGGLEQVPFREWAPVFERARKAGLRLAAHAGENGPAEGVRLAVEEAGVERLVHAVRAAEDPALLDFLAGRRIPVDVCVSSNLALVPELAAHPLPRMLRAGLRCALGTDDPGLIPCSLDGEMARARGLGLSPDECRLLEANGLEDAWCLQGSGTSGTAFSLPG